MDLKSNLISGRVAPGGHTLIEQASRGFNLLEVPNLAVLYNVAQRGTLYQDDTKATPVTANNDPIGAIVDLKGGYDATQSATNQRASYKVADLGGGPCLTGDAIDDFLASQAFVSQIPQPFTYVMCLQLQAPASTQSVMSGYSNGTFTLKSGRLRVVTSQYRLASTTQADTGIAADSGIHVIAASFNGASSSLRVDGNAPAIVTSTTGTVAIGEVGLLATFTDSSWSSARIGLAMLVAGAVSDQTFTDIRNYCRPIWGNP